MRESEWLMSPFLHWKETLIAVHWWSKDEGDSPRDCLKTTRHIVIKCIRDTCEQSSLLIPIII